MTETLDVSRVKYYVELVDEDGGRYDLADVLLDLSWQEGARSLGGTITLSIINCNMDARQGGAGRADDDYLLYHVRPGMSVVVYADQGEGKQFAFAGTIWQCDYLSQQEKVLTITAHDPLNRLVMHEDNRYYSSGMTTNSILEDICSHWGIPLVYEWESVEHDSKDFQRSTIGGMITDLLDDAAVKTGSKYVLLYKDDKLHILHPGTNQKVFCFTGDNAILTKDTITLNDLVTKVMVIGKESSLERLSIETVVESDVQLGPLQKIFVRNNKTTLEDAMTEAQRIIKERGRPKQHTLATVTDLPLLRKGEKIKMNAGNLVGDFIVKSIEHHASDKVMKMELERI